MVWTGCDGTFEETALAQDGDVARSGGYNAPDLAFRRRVVCDILEQVVFRQGEVDMGDKGKKDKGKREQHKKAQRTPEEKRKLKREKKENKNR